MQETTEITPQTAPAAVTRWTPDEMDRLEWLFGTLEAKRLVGEPLTSDEAEIQAALTELARAEQDAREAFGVFYLNTAPGDGQESQDALPTSVTERINTFLAARRRWGNLASRYLATQTPAPATRTTGTVRTGPRLRASLPASLTIPTALPARDLLTLLFAPQQWVPTPSGDALEARRGDTLVRVESDEITGLGPEQAIRQIAKQGASVAQTFFGLVALWMERAAATPDANPETYLTIYASDLLRFQQRKETPKGGYHQSDILTKGRDVYLLSRISVPVSSVTQFDGGRREVKTVSIGRLLSLESLDMAQETVQGDNGETRTTASIVRFRYHLGRQVHDWIGGSQPQYTRLSGKLLTYHPVRQKYQVLLGFTLAYYDRVNRKKGQTERRLSLPALLNLAAIEIPDKRIAAFFTSIEEALHELARDQVIPGLKLQKPDGWPDLLRRRDTRALIAGSVIIFPALPESPALPQAEKNTPLLPS